MDRRSGFGEISRASHSDHERHIQGFSPLSNLFLGEARILSVRSHHLKNIVEDPKDDRLSYYTLFWKGLARRRDLERIEHELARRAADLRFGIREGDPREIEWHVAPLITLCSEVTARCRRLRRTYFLSMAVTLVAYLLVIWLLIV